MLEPGKDISLIYERASMLYLRRSPSSVRNTVQSSSFLRGSVLRPLSLSGDMVCGKGGMWAGLVGDRT